jgi:hypothetical protein
MNPNCTNGNGPTGGGKVQFSPAAIRVANACTLSDADAAAKKDVVCRAQFPLNVDVTMTGVADPGHGGLQFFEGFVGEGCTLGSNSCTVKLDKTKAVRAQFCARVH